jgi:hypothetical protein
VAPAEEDVTAPSLSLTYVAFALLLGACDTSPAEPTPASAAARPAAKEIRWTAPPTWNVERTAEHGLYRAKYTIPSSGDAKSPAEMLVQHLGTGKTADPEAKLTEFLGEWEGPGLAQAKRDKLSAGQLDILTVEVAATYKMPMGPQIGPQKKAAAQVIKENYRGLGAVVKTADRGNWFFRLVGPSDTVEASRSAFLSLLEGIELE